MRGREGSIEGAADQSLFHVCLMLWREVMFLGLQLNDLYIGGRKPPTGGDDAIRLTHSGAERAVLIDLMFASDLREAGVPVDVDPETGEGPDLGDFFERVRQRQGKRVKRYPDDDCGMLVILDAEACLACRTIAWAITMSCRFVPACSCRKPTMDDVQRNVEYDRKWLEEHSDHEFLEK